MAGINFSKIEEEVLKFWEEKKIFQKSLSKESPQGDFVFYEGPPTANGRPGIHHVLARVYKDIVCRYKTMRGYRVPRKAGWDTHGLPVEIEVEKELNINGKPEIEKYGLEKFNEHCKKSVWKYKDEWEKLTRRIGFWLDLENPYITYDNDYIETVWWILKQIWQKGLLYQDYKVVPYCPRCGTTLSSHEVALGYKNVEEESIYLKFKLKNQEEARKNLKISPEEEGEIYFLVWTTTPWTLPANVALAVNKEQTYLAVSKNKEIFILAEGRLDILDNYKIIARFSGEELLNLEYYPLYQFISLDKPAYYLIHGDFVSLDEGTGIVHIAPAFGEEDMEVSKENDLPLLMTVDKEGKFIPEVKNWAGFFVKEADPLIIKDLENRGILFKKEMYAHDYPFCWRCGTPLLYYAKPSWFIRMTDAKIKNKLLENNQMINWVPSYIKEGRFGEWLRELKDWALSRERYWGTPLPIWKCEKCGYQECIGSFEELKKKSGKEIDENFDAHRPYIDKFTWTCPHCGGLMKRAPEVIDCWFDSGSMPLAQVHFPFSLEEKGEVSELIKKIPFPADYIAEGIDQTRGWFYTLLAISTLLDLGPSYRNVICLGLVLDEKGEKMSKSKGNVIDPWKIIDKYSVDALRWYLYTLNQPGEAKSFSEKGLLDVVKKVFLILWNVYSFYQLYAEDNLLEKSIKQDELHILDKWISARLNLLIKNTQEKLDNYDITGAARGITQFIDELSTWYLRRSRQRLKSKNKEEKKIAQNVLRETLLSLTKLMAPFAPFISEKIYLDLKGEKESVHLEDWPEVNEEMIDEELLNKMELIREICRLGLKARGEAGISVRQPLKKIIVKFPKLTSLSSDLEEIIKQELNIEEVLYKPSGEKVIELDTEITPELRKKWIKRELVRQINDLRKKANLTFQDSIILYYYSEDEEISEIIKSLLEDVVAYKAIKEKRKIDYGKELEIDGEKIWLGIIKN